MAATKHQPGVFCVDFRSDRICGVWQGRRAIRAGELPLAEGTIQGGRLSDRAQVTAVLQKLAESLRVPRGAAVALLVPAAFAEIHTLDPAAFGVAATETIPDALRFELGHRLFQELDEVIYDSQPADDVLVLVSAPREVIEERIWVIQDLGLRPVLVDVDLLGVFNGTEWPRQRSGIIVQVGREFLSCLLVRHGVPASLLTTEAASIAGIQKRIENNGASARSLFRALVATGGQETERSVAAAVKQWIALWAQQIAVEVRFAQHLLEDSIGDGSEQDLLEVRAAGAPLHVEGLREAIEVELEMPVRPIGSGPPGERRGEVTVASNAVAGLARRLGGQ
jgi:hypothetical protein